MSGIITGDITGGLAGAPYLAGVIKEKTTNPDGSLNKEANLIAHAILGGAVAAAQGNSALAGATGAVSGEAAVGFIKDLLYGKDTKIENLTQAQKENLSNLAQIASGLAVASVGGSTSDVGAAVSASKNAVENNYEGLLPPIIPIGEGTIQNAGAAGEVTKDVYLKCGDTCTPEDYKKAYQDAGLANRFEQLTEEQRKIIYSIPLAGWVYGGFDAIKDGDITRLLEAGVSQTEIGGFMMMLYRNQPNAPTESQITQKVEEVLQGKNKDTQIWTEGKAKDPISNAYEHWDKHKGDFPELNNSLEYVNATHNFVTNPPAGTLTKVRSNGDTLYYNPATNTFAIKDKNGVPRTMYKPEKGMEYWDKQK